MKEIIAVIVGIPLTIALCVLSVGGAGIVLDDWRATVEREERERVDRVWNELRDGKTCRVVFYGDEKLHFCD